MKHFLVTALFFLCLITPVQLNAEVNESIKPQFGLSPSMFEIEIDDKPVNQSLIVTNFKKMPVTMRVELYAWTLDAQHQLQIVPSSPQTLDQWIVINPVRFTIPPGGIQTIRFSVSPRLKPQSGENRAVLYLIEEPDPTNAEKGVHITAKLGIGIYAYVAPIVHMPKIINLSVNKSSSTLSLQILNEGNVHCRFRGRYIVWEKSAFSGLGSLKNLPDVIEKGHEPQGYLGQGTFPGDPVLPKMKRTYNLNLDIPTNRGPYVVAVFGELDDKPFEKIFQ